MVIEQLSFGQSLAGLLVDGVDGTPYVVATLTFDEARGVNIEVPYVDHDETGQFAHVIEWFHSRTPPPNLLFMSTEGPISLYNLRWGGNSSPSGATAARGSIRIGEAATAERDGALTDALKMRQVRSWLDGLNGWTSLSSVTTDYITEPDGRISRARGYMVKAKSSEPVTWQQGEATLSLEGYWRSSQEGDRHNRRHIIADDVVLESTFPEARLFNDHRAEQRKVADLLVLLFGAQIAFRRHQLRDERFVARVLSGKVVDTPYVDLVSERTFRDRVLPTPDSEDRPLAYLAHIGPDGLAKWADNYDRWKRFILPAVAVFGPRGSFAEDIVVSTSTSIEAASHLIGVRGGEETMTGRGGKPTTATHIYRCLHLLDISWPERIGSIEGLAKAIAENYNTIKHADRGDLPDSRQTILISQINRWIVRLLALHLAGQGDELLEDYRGDSRELWKLGQFFDAYELAITTDGIWETRSSGSRT
jgi:hypothetical protein